MRRLCCSVVVISMGMSCSKCRPLLALLALWSCQKTLEIDPSTVFRYNEPAGISSLDPAFARNQANNWAVNQLFDGLVRLDERLVVQPAVARRWRISDSGRHYRFWLRDSVYFHENECFSPQRTRRVTAHDFQYSLERLRSAELAAPGGWVLRQVDRLEARNDSVLDIHLHQSFPPFLSLLAMQYCAVIPPEAVVRYGPAFGQQPVGCGPFRFKRWLPQQKLVLRRHSRYYEKDKQGHSLPYLEAVAISFIPDEQSAFLEFVKGNLDLLSGLDVSYKDELLTYDGRLQARYQEKFRLQKLSFLNTEYLGIMMDSAAYANPQHPLRQRPVRQALNYAFDRQRMMRFLRSNIGSAATQGFIPRGLPSFADKAAYGYSYQPERAAQLLREAGYPQGQGMPEIKLLTNANYLDLCEYLQAEWQKLGIPVRVEVVPPSTLREMKAQGKALFFRASWIADYPDAENYLSLFYGPNRAPGGPNYTFFSDSTFDTFYRRAYTENTATARRQLYRQMDSLVMAQAPVIPLYYDEVLRFHPVGLQGLAADAMNMLDLSRVRKGLP